MCKHCNTNLHTRRSPHIANRNKQIIAITASIMVIAEEKIDIPTHMYIIAITYYIYLYNM